MKILKRVKIYIAFVLVFVLTTNLYGCALLSKDATVKEKQTEQSAQNITYKPIEKDNVEKYALRLQEKISELTNHYHNGRVEAVKKDADNVIKLLEDSQVTMADYQKEVEDTVVSLKSDTLLQRQKEYEKEYSEKTEETKTLLHRIADAENDAAMEKAMTDLNALFAEEKPEVYSSDPENLAENVEIQSEEVGDIATYEANMQNKTDTSEESQSDAELLELANETNVTDAIKKKAEELKTPLNIYNYLKNTLDYEWYYGSRKGAGQTYETLAGNDKDQASLLIAMLRYFILVNQIVRWNCSIEYWSRK